MSACPACGKDVRPLWPSCRACGTLLMTLPAPLEPANAPAPGPSADEQFFARATLQPIAQLSPTTAPPAYTHTSGGAGPSSELGKWFVLAGMVVFMIAAVATAYFTFKPAASKNQTPVALAPRAPTAGLPTSLDVIVRVEAESARHTALQAVEQVGSGDIATLENMQPDYQWIAGDQGSTDPHTVSVGQNAGVVTIAVAASNKDVCAFGQWSSGATPMYVTMEHQSTCAAVQAPTTGWSTQPGGAGSDLPDDNP